MNDARIEAALIGLGQQRPKVPELTVNNMVRTVSMLSRERAKRMGTAAEPVSRRRELTTGTPVKNNKKTL